MRQIKASEVKPGMTIRWTFNELTSECPVRERGDTDEFGGVPVTINSRSGVYVQGNTPVTVLAEPAPVQPEEPTEFEAKARVRDGRFVRLDWRGASLRHWYEIGTGRRWTWDELCEMGPVQVVPDQGWTVPDDREPAPNVPDRIEEWGTWEDVPEGVAVTAPGLVCHYRKNQGVIESNDPGVNLGWVEIVNRPMSYVFAPWTRVTDA